MRVPWTARRSNQSILKEISPGCSLEGMMLKLKLQYFLRCDGNTGNSFPTAQEKDPSSRTWRRKRGSSGCGRDSRASSRVETGMSGNFLSCSKGVKDPLEVPEARLISLVTPLLKWVSSRLEGRTSWIFSSCARCSRLTTDIRMNFPPHFILHTRPNFCLEASLF